MSVFVCVLGVSAFACVWEILGECVCVSTCHSCQWPLQCPGVLSVSALILASQKKIRAEDESPKTRITHTISTDWSLWTRSPADYTVQTADSSGSSSTTIDRWEKMDRAVPVVEVVCGPATLTLCSNGNIACIPLSCKQEKKCRTQSCSLLSLPSPQLPTLWPSRRW